MRLINTETGKFEEFLDSKRIPHYAILSHTWEQPPGREQTYQDVLKIQEKFGLSSSDGVPLNPLPKNPVSSPQTEVLDASSETHMPIPSAVPQPPPPPPHLFPRMFACLGYLLLSILARASLYLLISPQSLRSIWDPDSGLSEKIRKACEVAREDGYRYIWIDSSCIDKTSSSKLSEAINSMFAWYRDAQICYAFLSDVPVNEDVRADDPDLPHLVEDFRKQWKNWVLGHKHDDDEEGRGAENRPQDVDKAEERSVIRDFGKTAKHSKFWKSRWFTRAWTLQELIAPRTVVFLSQDWKGLGTKESLADLIEEITHIDCAVLTHKKPLAEESVAERMRWAAGREATRVEDEAYSLLGIFGITMSTLYGEGQYAFQRLQEEILRRIPDPTLFAWGACRPLSPKDFKYIDVSSSFLASPFASSPWSFTGIGGKTYTLSTKDARDLQIPVEEYTFTPRGVRTKMCLIPMRSLAPSLDINFDFRDSSSSQNHVEHSWRLIVLGWYQAGPQTSTCDKRHLLGKLCVITHENPDLTALHVPKAVHLRLASPAIGENVHDNWEFHHRTLLFTISLDDFVDILSLVEPITVYLSHPTPSTFDRDPMTGGSITRQFMIRLSSWAQSVLQPGYTIKSDPRLAGDHSLQLNNSSVFSFQLFNKLELVDILIEYRYMHVTVFDDESEDSWQETAVVIEARIWSSPDSTTLNRSPPYTSSIWTVNKRALSLPRRDIHVTKQSGEEITLQLCLGIATYGHYHTHVEVTTNATSPDPPHSLSLRADYLKWEGLKMPPRITKLHGKDLKFTLLGSVRRALEAQGYSVHLERHGGNPGSSYSHTLTLSDVNSGFTISIKYFHDLHTNAATTETIEFQDLIVVTSVTLESSSVLDGSNSYQDGPHVLRLWDRCGTSGWTWSHGPEKIYLASPVGEALSVTLGLDMAWTSEYYLVVDIQRAEKYNCWSNFMYNHTHDQPGHRLSDSCESISLILPGHTKHSLQERGYKVHFRGPNEDHSDPSYHLTLSDAKLTIGIKYSHYLSTGSNGRQELTFKACVDITKLALQGSQEAATQLTGQIVSWDAWRMEVHDSSGAVKEQGGWRWALRQKDVKFVLPGGRKLTLRLGFYLVWLSEYCITVEVNPWGALSRTSSQSSLGIPSPRMAGGDGESDASDDAGTQEATSVKSDEEELAPFGGVLPMALPVPGGEDAEVERAGAYGQAEHSLALLLEGGDLGSVMMDTVSVMDSAPKSSGITYSVQSSFLA